MKRRITHLKYGLLACLLLTLVTACEDPVPDDYIPRTVVEGFMIVDQPIQGIKVLTSQPVSDSFSYAKSFIRDAKVQILSGSETFDLVYHDTPDGGEYYYPVSTALIKPETYYKLQVTVGGTVLTGETTTPGRIQLVKSIADTVQYPKDTLNLTLTESLRLSWTAATGANEYLLSMKCIDTLGYGKYLHPPTEEKNRRIVRFWEENAPRYDDVTRWGFVPTNDIPGSWNAFKWFGRQELTIYAADYNFINWFKLTHFGSSPQYSPILGSIKNGMGVFASASTAKQSIFVLKNQP